MNLELWITGGITMLVGMGIVFSFLVILVFAIQIMAKCVAYLDKICPPPVVEAKKSKKTVQADDSEAALAVAIAYTQG